MLDRFSRGDAVVAGALVLFAVLAIALYDSVSGLSEMARGIGDTGAAIRTSGAETANEIRTSVGRAAEAVESIPLVGSNVAGTVRDTAGTTADAVERETRINGQLLIDSGRQGERDAQATARLVGWLAFLVPAILLLVQWVPRRIDDWRRPAVRPGPEPRPRAVRR